MSSLLSPQSHHQYLNHQLRSTPNASNKSPAPQLLLLRRSDQVFSATEGAVRYSPTTAAYLGHQAHPVQDEHRLLPRQDEVHLREGTNVPRLCEEHPIVAVHRRQHQSALSEEGFPEAGVCKGPRTW